MRSAKNNLKCQLPAVFASVALNSQIKSGKSKPATKYPRITLRLSEEENALLRDLADGVTVSSYVRECLFGKDTNKRKTRRRHQPVADEQSLACTLAMLGETRIANNLNQLAHKANMGELKMSSSTLAQIEEAYDHIQAMRKDLVKAIGLIEQA